MTVKRSRKPVKALPSQDTQDQSLAVLLTARSQVMASVGDIIAAMIEAAKGGNHLPAKFLFDFAGLSAAPSEAAPPPSLAEVLLERLQALPAAEPKNPVPAGDAATSSR